MLLTWPNTVAENLVLYVLKWGKNVHPWIIGSWRQASFTQGGKIQFGTKSQLLRASKYGFLDIKNNVVKHVMPNSCFSLVLENKQRGIKQLGYSIRSAFFLPNLWRFWWISDFYVANTSEIMAGNWMAKWRMEGSKDLFDNYSLSNNGVTDGGWEKGLWLVRLSRAEESILFEEGLCQALQFCTTQEISPLYRHSACPSSASKQKERSAFPSFPTFPLGVLFIFCSHQHHLYVILSGLFSRYSWLTLDT